LPEIAVTGQERRRRIFLDNTVCVPKEEYGKLENSYTNAQKMLFSRNFIIQSWQP